MKYIIWNVGSITDTSWVERTSNPIWLTHIHTHVKDRSIKQTTKIKTDLSLSGIILEQNICQINSEAQKK